MPDDAIQSVKRLYELGAKPSAPPAGQRELYAKTDGWHDEDSAANDKLLVAASVPTLGDLLYGDATPAWVKLAGNVTTTRKFLRQVGDGALSAAPAWDTLQVADIPQGPGSTLDADTLDGSHAAAFATSGHSHTHTADILGTSNQVSVANGSDVLWGSTDVTLSLPQDIHTGASPTFANLTDSGITATHVVYGGVAGLLTGSANMTFNGTNLLITGTEQVTRLGIGAAADGTASLYATAHLVLAELGVDPAAPGVNKRELYAKADGFYEQNSTPTPRRLVTTKQIEIDFGATTDDYKYEKSFTIIDAEVSATSKILAQVAYVAPTGREADEAEVDPVSIVCAPGAGNFIMRVRGLEGRLYGTYKVNYTVG